MHPSELVEALQELRSAGLTSSHLTRLHHFSLKGGNVSLPVVIAYFQESNSLRGRNIALSERLRYVAEEVRARPRDLDKIISAALLAYPLGSETVEAVRSPNTTTRTRISPGPASQAVLIPPHKLGDVGENLVLALLRARGYTGSLLPRNYPTYDIKVAMPDWEFSVSVKTSRTRQHVRLGTRDSVERLSAGNFVFALLRAGGDQIAFSENHYKLLILPAEMVKRDSLTIHDTYWAERESDREYSVMVKGYDSSHKQTWARWNEYSDAWHQMPSPLSLGAGSR